MNTKHPTLEELANKRVLVVGDAMLDRYWFGAVERISPEAPVPVVRITHDEERLGGAANVALNVKALGAQCTLMTVIGTDEPGQKLRTLIERQQINALLGHDPNLYTIVKLRVIGRSQQLMRIDFENQPDHEVLQQLLVDYEKVLPEHDAVLFSDYGKGGLTHIPHMIKQARQVGIPVLVDPKGSDYERYAGANVITPNRAELAQVVGQWSDEADLHQRAMALRQRLGLDVLLLTRSEEGMTMFDSTTVTEPAFHVKATAREVFDVTGAGDTVIATMATLVACKRDLRYAATQANRAGSIVVGKFGTATVSHHELFSDD